MSTDQNDWKPGWDSSEPDNWKITASPGEDHPDLERQLEEQGLLVWGLSTGRILNDGISMYGWCADLGIGLANKFDLGNGPVPVLTPEAVEALREARDTETKENEKT